MSIIVSNCQYSDEQQFQTLACVHYTIFSVVKLDVFIRAQFLDRILAPKKTTRIPRVHLVIDVTTFYVCRERGTCMYQKSNLEKCLIRNKRDSFLKYEIESEEIRIQIFIQYNMCYNYQYLLIIFHIFFFFSFAWLHRQSSLLNKTNSSPQVFCCSMQLLV